MSWKPEPEWLPLLTPEWRNWRIKQIGRGRDPDRYIEEELKKAKLWPPKPITKPPRRLT